MKIFEIKMIGSLVIEKLPNLEYRVEDKRTGLARCFDSYEQAINPKF